MTTKNNRPTKFAQTLESPGADQWYPVWEEEKMWAKVSELSASTTNSRRRKYWLWFLVLGLWWSASAAERLSTRHVPSHETVPIAHTESTRKPRISPISNQPQPAGSPKKSSLSPLPKNPVLNLLPADSVAKEEVLIAEKFMPLPRISGLATAQQVSSTTLIQIPLPPKPWRKKYSTLYTLRVPETPFDWDMNDGYVRRLERQLKSAVPPPNNGWMAFQLHWESGTAFTLVHHSRDTLNIQDTEIHLRTKNR